MQSKTSLALLAALTLVAAVAIAQPPPQVRQLDELDDISPWRSLASDGASASVHGAKGMQGAALVLEFDLAGTAGYAAATRVLPTMLPEDYEISFWMRGEAGRNHFEMKLVDASGDNVWWFRRPDYRFSGDWQQVRIKRRQIEFAWGPTTDKTLRQFQSIEFVVSAGSDGGKGNLWFDRLSLKPVVRAQVTARPSLRASSEQAANAAALAMDGNGKTSWRSQLGAASPQTLEIDLQQLHEFGGVEIDWAPGQHATRYAIEVSPDGQQWQAARAIDGSNGGRDSHWLPESEARFIRLTLRDGGRQFGVAEVHIRDLEFGASANAFVQSLAKRVRRGCYPRGFVNEQSYWTVVGVDGDAQESLLSEDGAVEARKGSFSVEPFILTRGGLLTWADVAMTHSLADGYLPIPTVQWKHADVGLSITAYAAGDGKGTRTRMSYRVSNPRASRQAVTLALAVRPFQVNPPSQFLNTAGGVSGIQDLSFDGTAVLVDKVASVLPRTPPQSFRAVSFDAESPCEWLTKPEAQAQAHDPSGLASGALLYRLELPPGGAQEIVLDLPLYQGPHSGDAAPLAEARKSWQGKLNRVELLVPEEGREWFDALRSSLAHILINRDGPALQPGARAYERSWIRDGAMTSELLLRLGHEDVVKEFLRWYARYQFADGKVPCCVDRRGADPVPENDSDGEYLFLIDAIHRYTGDAALLRESWPSVVKTVQHLEELRLSERTAANMQEGRKVYYGLLPASISHEGYAAKPMHSYWDDFWALAGYESAIRVARALDEKADMRRFIESRDQFRADLYRSLQIAMKTHGIGYLPGAAELGDFDPTSTSIAVAPVGEQQMLPPSALTQTFERYWQDFSKRRTDKSWDAYTPYEWRNLGTMIRLGWRARGLELVDFFMKDRRPTAWNQWAEVVGREPRTVRFIGDMPHGWVASDYGRALLDMFAYERPADEALVLMAGVPEKWIEKEGFAVRNLRTPYGRLSYSLTVEGGRRILDIGGIELPEGGVVVAWPEGLQLPRQAIQRGSARWIGTELRVSQLPFTIAFSP